MEVEKINEFQEEITRQLMIINSKLTQHATSAGSNYKLEECMKMLPLKSVEEINNFESFVIENKLEDLMAKELSGIGGENCKILTKRIMYRMVSNSAGQYYSMEGAKGKNVFKTLTLFAIIRIEVEETSISELFEEKTTLTTKATPYNTIRTRAYIWSAFEKFCNERKYSLNESTSPEELGEILADWGFNMRRTNGTDYKEGVVKTMWNVTAKMLQEMFYEKFKIKFDPFRDIEFKKARDSRDIKRRQLKSGKSNVDTGRLNETERYQLYTMWDEETPSGLQRKFYHIAAFALSWKNAEASNCLTRYFKKEINDSGIFTGRVEYNPTFGETMEESNPCKSKWLVVNKDDSNVCPVRLLFKLLEKRKTNSNIKTDRLFLTANPNWNRTQTSAWYKDCPVGCNQIRAWIKEVAEMLGTDTTRIKITNRSKNPSTSKIL